MKIYRGLNDPDLKKAPRAMAIGMFDGVHRGHVAILKKAMRQAKKLKARSMVITFDPHPQEVLAPHKPAPKFLMSAAHRLRLFEEAGLDEALVVRFDKKFARMTHERFLMNELISRLGLRAISVGYDFRFGRGASGDHDYLIHSARRAGFKLSITRPLKIGGQIVSSTRVRRLIEAGRLDAAERMLGRAVSVYGTVVRGRGRGRKLGFPTANLDPHHETLPPPGVYSATGRFRNGRDRCLRCVVHIGRRPTFHETEKTVEVFFPGFRGDLYGKDIELLFSKRLRGIHKFSGAGELQAQIRRDLRKAGF